MLVSRGGQRGSHDRTSGIVIDDVSSMTQVEGASASAIGHEICGRVRGCAWEGCWPQKRHLLFCGSGVRQGHSGSNGNGGEWQAVAVEQAGEGKTWHVKAGNGRAIAREHAACRKETIKGRAAV